MSIYLYSPSPALVSDAVTSGCLLPVNLLLVVPFRTTSSQLSPSGRLPPSCPLPDNYPPYSLRTTLSQSPHKYKSSNEYWCSMGTRFSPSVSHSMPQCSGGYKLSVGLLSCKESQQSSSYKIENRLKLFPCFYSSNCRVRPQETF